MGIGQIIGEFKGWLVETMRLDTLVRPRGSEVSFVIFVNGAHPRSRKSHPQKEDAEK